MYLWIGLIFNDMHDVFISYSRHDYVNERGDIIPENPVSKIMDASAYQAEGHGFDPCHPLKESPAVNLKILAFKKETEIHDSCSGGYKFRFRNAHGAIIDVHN